MYKMYNRKYILNILFVVFTAVGFGQDTKISQKNGDHIENEGKDQMERILKTYSSVINNWLFTNEIVIDKTVIPFSHPVLTLNCKYLQNDSQQLATFLHEQFHWFVSNRSSAEKNTINEFKQIFFEVPVGGKLGARDVYSTYLHLIVCDLEYQALTKIFGEIPAKNILSTWNHYTWIYKTVTGDSRVRNINIKYGFIVP